WKLRFAPSAFPSVRPWRRSRLLGFMASYGSPAPNASGPNGSRFTSVAEAAQSQNIDAVLEMLAQGYRVDSQGPDGNTALHWVAWFRLDSLLSTLLEKRARPDIGNQSGECPVHWAAKAANVTALDAMTRGNRGLLSV
ncbi:unnamed protein product, partial [Effrenium voratum]